MSLKKIVATAGIAAGAIAAFAGTAQADVVDPVQSVSDLGDKAGISLLHNMGGGVEATYVPREGSDLLPSGI